MATWQLYSAWDDLGRSDTGSMRTKKGKPTHKKSPSDRKAMLVLGDPAEAAVARRIRAGLQA
jgi:hypothetical protein